MVVVTTQVLSDARAALVAAADVVAVGQVVRTAARTLADAHGATFVLREREHCFYEDEDAIAPLWKGQRFPLTACISGWAMLNQQVAIVPDIEQDQRIPIEAYRPTFVRSLVMVPVGDPPAAAIGAYWVSPPGGGQAAVDALLPLAAATAEALDRVGLEGAPWAPNFSDAATSSR